MMKLHFQQWNYSTNLSSGYEKVSALSNIIAYPTRKRSLHFTLSFRYRLLY